MLKKIKSFQSIDYREVWYVLSYRKGKVYEARNTGKVIGIDDVSSLPSHYFTASFSTKVTSEPTMEFDLVEVKEFRRVFPVLKPRSN